MNYLTDITKTSWYESLSSKEKLKLDQIVARHPMKIPDYYYKLIDFTDEEDPIKKQAFPSLEEISSLGDYDTSGEASNTKMKGLQHKYEQTVLVLATNVCFMYCRHCFRKRMVGYSAEEISLRMEEAVNYIKSHEEVNNVLITGGDSFTMSNQMIENYLKKLTKIKHLDFIRFGTRSLVVNPERINEDEKLVSILNKYNKLKNIIVVTHFNHPKEVTEEAKTAALKLREAGIMIRNQAVLLKGVNDNSDTLAELLNKLMKIGVHPYYVFQCRPVKGGIHFQVDFLRGIDIINKAREKLNGLSKAFRYIMSHKRGKIEIIDFKDNEIYFKFHQNKFPDDSNQFFTREITYKKFWLDDDLNLI